MYITLKINKRKFIFSLFILLGLSLAFFTEHQQIDFRPVLVNTPTKTIIVDPGHGSIDTGSHYENIYEKDINLSLGKKLATELSNHNYRVVLTRKEDKLYHDSRREDIRHRPKYIQSYDGDIFISIHVNDFTSPEPSGSQVFYPHGSKVSKQLAQNITAELAKLRSDNNRPVSAGDYYVLNQTTVPAVLIETGFISNPQDRKLLTDEDYQNQLTTAIRKGVDAFTKR